MDTAIQIVWWIGLAGALLGTLVILKLVSLVLRALRDIHQLARFTADAARGIRNHVAQIPRLAAAAEPARELSTASGALAEAAASVAALLSAAAPRQAD